MIILIVCICIRNFFKKKSLLFSANSDEMEEYARSKPTQACYNKLLTFAVSQTQSILLSNFKQFKNVLISGANPGRKAAGEFSGAVGGGLGEYMDTSDYDGEAMDRKKRDAFDMELDERGFNLNPVNLFLRFGAEVGPYITYAKYFSSHSC